MLHLLAAAILAGDETEELRLRDDPPAGQPGDGVSLELRARFWLAFEGNSRMRSMEQEALGKGGSGRGSLFQYEDVEVEGYTPIPEIEARLRFGPHEIWTRASTASRSAHIQLSGALEYDGDLHVAGEQMDVEFKMTMAEVGYSYRVVSGDLEVRLGAEVIFWRWYGALNSLSGGETSDEIIDTLLLPVPNASLRWTLADGLAWQSEFSFMYGMDLRRGIAIGQNSQGILRFTTELELSLGPVAFTLGLGYSVQDSISFEHGDEADLLNYRRLGASLGLAIRF